MGRDEKRGLPPDGVGEGWPAPGTVVAGRYRIGELLGAGGFAPVFEAEHLELGSAVALKLFPRDLFVLGDRLRRFQQEARAAASIEHPNVVRVFDLGADDRFAFLAMERLEGETLESRIRRDHPLDPDFVGRVAAQIADAVGAAHGRGVIHRDIKPANVLLVDRDGEPEHVKVIDFGIAKVVAGVDGELTASGQVFGTPRFMAPEQLRGAKRVSERSDVYSIGALLYRAFTARYPFDGETYPELVLKIASEDPPPLAELRPALDPRWVALVERAMARRPEDRFPTAKALADAARAILEGRSPRPVEPPLPPRRALLRPLVLGALAVGLGIAVWMGTRAGGPQDAAGERPTPPAGPPPSDAPATTAGAVSATLEGGPSMVTTERASVLVRSSPSGAEVFRDDRRLGVTPLEVDRPQGDARIVLTLASRGHRRRTVTLDERSEPTLEVTLPVLGSRGSDPGPAERAPGSASPAPDPFERRPLLPFPDEP